MLYVILYIVIAIVIFCIIKRIPWFEYNPDGDEEYSAFLVSSSIFWIVTVPIAITILIVYGLYKLIDYGIDEIYRKILSYISKRKTDCSKRYPKSKDTGYNIH